MKRFTILHTIETGGPGGAETVLLNLASMVDRSRFHSIVLLSEDRWLRSRLRERGVETALVSGKAWYDFRLLRGMVGLILKEKVDLIHSHLPDQNFYSCVAGSLTRRKTIVTYHGPVELAQAGELRHAIKLWWVRHAADGVVVVCDHVGELLVQAGFPRHKIVRIYNGIDMARFNRSSGGKLRKELGLSREARLVGMVANIRESKGYEFFIRAARKVADCVPHVQFVAVGEIDKDIGDRLLPVVEELGLRGRFHFLGFRADVPEILSDLDVFVLSSVSEGFPLVTLEAMAASRPMVVTRCGGPQEVVEDCRTGLLVPPADASALAAKICELLADPRRAAELAQNARAKVLSEFSLEKMVSHYEGVYERFLGLH